MRFPSATRPVWRRRDGKGENVTLPSRRFNSQGEARTYSLLRAIGDPTVLDRVRDQVLAAYVAAPANDTVSAR